MIHLSQVKAEAESLHDQVKRETGNWVKEVEVADGKDPDNPRFVDQDVPVEERKKCYKVPPLESHLGRHPACCITPAAAYAYSRRQSTATCRTWLTA